MSAKKVLGFSQTGQNLAKAVPFLAIISGLKTGAIIFLLS
jgi:hypothetical protein